MQPILTKKPASNEYNQSRTSLEIKSMAAPIRNTNPETRSVSPIQSGGIHVTNRSKLRIPITGRSVSISSMNPFTHHDIHGSDCVSSFTHSPPLVSFTPLLAPTHLDMDLHPLHSSRRTQGVVSVLASQVQRTPLRYMTPTSLRSGGLAL